MISHSWIAHFFLLMNDALWYGWIYWSLFIRSPFEIHLGCFWFFPVTNKSAVNIHLLFFCGLKSSTHVGEGLWSSIARLYGQLLFSFIRNDRTVFQSVYAILPSRQQWGRVLLFRIFSSICWCVLDLNHPNSCVVVSRCFNL